MSMNNSRTGLLQCIVGRYNVLRSETLVDIPLEVYFLLWTLDGFISCLRWHVEKNPSLLKLYL